MNAGRDVERLIVGWLDEEAPARAPDRILTSAALVIDHTKQRRAWRVPWRLPTMNPAVRVAAIALIAIVAVAAAFSIVKLRSSPVGAPATTPPSIEGTWQVAISRAEMLAAGIADAGEDNTGNWGPFSLSIHSGTYELAHLSSPQITDSGTYTLANGVFTMTTSGNEVFSYPYTVTETTLTFGQGGPVKLRAKPWTRVGLPTGAGASTPSPAAPPQSPAPGAGPIDGTYRATFTGNDPQEISKGTGGHQIPVGTWKIVIDGTAVTMFNPDSPQDGFGTRPAVYLAGDQVELPADLDCPNQQGTPSSGTYHYVVDGTSLTFTLVGTDTCADRTATLTAHPWRKS